MSAPSLPPLFDAVATPAGLDPLAAAAEAAEGGVDGGTLFWSAREDRFEVAIALAPEQPRAKALLAALVAQVALGDAFGALSPPEAGFQWSWPDQFWLNGARVGTLRARLGADGDDGAPGWLVVALLLQIAPLDAAEPGLAPDQSALALEDCGMLTPVDLLEAWARHFLYWLNRWEEDGARPVFDAWSARALGVAQDVALRHRGATRMGRLLGLDETGGLLLKSKTGVVALSLEDAFADPALWPPAEPPRFAVAPAGPRAAANETSAEA